MGIKNNNNNHHHHHYHHQISSFNPALCLRPPLHPPHPPPMLIKDIFNTLPSSNNKTLMIPSDDLVLSPSPPSKRSGGGSRNKTRDREVQLFLSPRIGCMGQIKRSSSCSNGNGNGNGNGNKKKLFQFQRMFSNMSLKSSRGSARVEDDCFNISSRRRDDDISIADTMDLPLPVVKEFPRRDAEVCSLWRRRKGGDGLRLQGMEHLRDSFWRSEDRCRLAA